MKIWGGKKNRGKDKSLRKKREGISRAKGCDQN